MQQPGSASIGNRIDSIITPYISVEWIEDADTLTLLSLCLFSCVSNSKEVNHVELPKADKLASATQKGPTSGGPVASIKKEIVDSKECKRIETREDDWGEENYEKLQDWYNKPRERCTL